MINWLQILLYKASCIAPIVIFIGILFLLQNVNVVLCIGLIIIGAIFSGYALFFIQLCKRKLSPIPITVENIAPNDGIAYAYIVTYLVPLAGVIWEENQWIWIVLAFIAVMVLLKVNTLSFNPILLAMGYHCYKVSLATGMAECFVISKQKRINNKNQIKVVQRVNSFLLIDEGGR